MTFHDTLLEVEKIKLLIPAVSSLWRPSARLQKAVALPAHADMVSCRPAGLYPCKPAPGGFVRRKSDAEAARHVREAADPEAVAGEARRAPIDWLHAERWHNGLAFRAVDPGIVRHAGILHHQDAPQGQARCDGTYRCEILPLDRPAALARGTKVKLRYYRSARLVDGRGSLMSGSCRTLGSCLGPATANLPS